MLGMIRYPLHLTNEEAGYVTKQPEHETAGHKQTWRSGLALCCCCCWCCAACCCNCSYRCWLAGTPACRGAAAAPSGPTTAGSRLTRLGSPGAAAAVGAALAVGSCLIAGGCWLGADVGSSLGCLGAGAGGASSGSRARLPCRSMRRSSASACGPRPRFFRASTI